MDESYPLRYSVDYPDRQLSRLTTFFRILRLRVAADKGR